MNASYDPGAFPPFAVTVDIVVLAVTDVLEVLLVERGNEPFLGVLALPGGFVLPDESLTSRNQSPSRFTDKASASSVIEGNRRIHHSPREQVVLPDADQRAEGGASRRGAHAEEGQRRLGDDREGEGDRRDHQHRSEDVGQEVAEQDSGRLSSDQPGGLHVVLLRLDHRRAAYGARELHPLGQADREDQHPDRHLLAALGRQQPPRHPEYQQRDEDRGARSAGCRPRA